jgi:putative transposase
MMTGAHTVFYHRYHIGWITKYRYAVLEGAVRARIREIIRQVCAELGVTIVKGVLSRDHVHMFVSIPPQLAVSDVVRRMKGRSSHKVQREFPALKKRYWGRHFWARGYFCSTSGNVIRPIVPICRETPNLTLVLPRTLSSVPDTLGRHLSLPADDPHSAPVSTADAHLCSGALTT